MSSDPEQIVERIDEGVLCPRSHEVARRLAINGLSPLCDEVIKAFDEGRSVGNIDLLTRLWKEIESLSSDRQGGRRMLISLLQPDAGIDGYEAGFLLLWADEESIPREAIVSAFNVS
jgi:hypothetical protein